MSERKLEDEYFAKLDRETRAALKAKLDAEHAAIEASERRALHFHKCGKCGNDMVTQAFRGEEIEVCTGCGAVLLDPGELEKLSGEDESGIIGSMLSLFAHRSR